ncbi:MAG: hypothetical protein GXP29_01435 [Planctomycetes bacterium]|nr:hypothetical protein [Planctomycetota bacterium]
MKRSSVAMFSNVIVPGSGMVLLRREWSGLAVSVLFAVFAQILIFSKWITPLDVPGWASSVALGGACVVWAGSQWLVVRRIRAIRAPELAVELDHLRQQSIVAMEAGDFAEAHRELLVALSVNDEDAATWLLWSRLMRKMNKPRAARLGCRRVLQLSNNEQDRKAAREGLREG